MPGGGGWSLKPSWSKEKSSKYIHNYRPPILCTQFQSANTCQVKSATSFMQTFFLLIIKLNELIYFFGRIIINFC